MNAEQRCAEYHQILTRQGFTPEVDEDGDILFMFEGMHYVILIDDDEHFFRLVFPNFWPVEDEPERARAMKAALQVTSAIKAAKVFVHRDNLSASIEMFVESPAAVAGVLRRCLGALQSAVQSFQKEMLEGAPAH